MTPIVPDTHPPKISEEELLTISAYGVVAWQWVRKQRLHDGTQVKSRISEGLMKEADLVAYLKDGDKRPKNRGDLTFVSVSDIDKIKAGEWISLPRKPFTKVAKGELLLTDVHDMVGGLGARSVRTGNWIPARIQIGTWYHALDFPDVLKAKEYLAKRGDCFELRNTHQGYGRGELVFYWAPAAHDFDAVMHEFGSSLPTAHEFAKKVMEMDFFGLVATGLAKRV